jgi:hypothetical protein
MEIEDIWTADFEKFKTKVEAFLGNLEVLAEKYPDIYAHQVLSHGFMEYAGIRRLDKKIKKKIKGKHGTINSNDPIYHNLFDQYLKREYLTWAVKNELPRNLLEQGWTEFCED